MRFAYADPPYLGMCARYDHNHPDGRCWDDLDTHQALIERLDRDYDGWALSLHTPSLRAMLNLCPEGVHVMAWCKTWASWKPGVYPARSWEPIIISGPKKRRYGAGDAMTPRDWHACHAIQNGFFGGKPESMVWWLLDCLGVDADDDFDDLFVGSGAVTSAWERWKAQKGSGSLFLPETAVQSAVWPKDPKAA